MFTHTTTLERIIRIVEDENEVVSMHSKSPTDEYIKLNRLNIYRNEERFPVKSMFRIGVKNSIKNYRKPHTTEAQELLQLNPTDFRDLERLKFSYKSKLEQGSRVDVARFLDGDTKCWGGSRRIKVKDKTAKVYIDYGANCNTDRYEFKKQCLSALLVCESLERSGVQTEIVLAFKVTNIARKGRSEVWKKLYGVDYNEMILYFTVKRTQDYLDMGYLAFVAGDSQFFRDVILSYCNYIFSEQEYIHRESGIGFMEIGRGRSIILRKKDIKDQSNFILVPREMTKRPEEFAREETRIFMED